MKAKKNPRVTWHGSRQVDRQAGRQASRQARRAEAEGRNETGKGAL